MKKWKKTGKKLLGFALAAAMVCPGIEIPVRADEETRVGEEYQSEKSGRTQVNFNREWKFYLGDAEGASLPEFDDSAWSDVALPHNFSVPYDMESSFYVGYGWYRKSFEVPSDWEDKRINIEFEGVFQMAEVYVNGQPVGTHEGGYTGFEYDITDFVKPGANEIAVRVNNIWQPDLTPRAGDHQFTGGIYRDVYLNVTDDVHVNWYGTFVTTPDLTNPGFDESAVNVPDNYPSEDEILENIENRRSNVNVQTEVENDSDTAKTVSVIQQVVDADNVVVARFSSPEQVIEPGEIYNFDDTSKTIEGIHLWDTEDPYLYEVHTTVYADGEVADTYESPLGFRWAQYKNDGFYLNGEKVLLDGANAHQDHGGWADAVTNQGFYRDVAMLKEAGMNFIRGSHYPHDPSYAKACDELGMLFWSESVFWGMGGCAGKDEPATLSASDWFKDAYPQNPADEEAFENSCKQALTDMIRVNRNHPSVINWSMGNEVFFTDSDTQQKAKDLVNELRNLSHLLDPTRKAGMGGVQREGYDSLEICDIAGYNGDGGKFENLTMPNIVAEYGSKAANRPGEYRPFYDQIAKPGTIDEYQLQKNSAGLALWCAFHHGTIGGNGLATMGVVDYYRLPLNSWYWYREHNTGVAPEQSVDGTAVKMELRASQETLGNNGTDDAQIIVTMKDKNDQWVNQTQEVTLEVVSGPGVFPGGKEYTFIPNKTIRDGKAAIEFRSYYSGETIIRATSKGLPDAEIRLTTVNTDGVEEGEEPDGFYTVKKEDNTEKIEDPKLYGTANVASGRPAFPSSNDEDRTLAVDGDMATSWVAGVSGNGEYWMSDLEFAQYVYKIKLGFSKEPYPYKIEVAMDKDTGPWTTVAEYTKETIKDRPYEESIDGNEARYVKITFTDVPKDEKAFLSECEVYGTTSSQSPQYMAESTYLSDMEWESATTFWGEKGVDVSCQGNPIRVGGETYEKGLGFHADSEIVYNLDGKYSRFYAVAGIDDEVGGNIGDAIFQVFADEKLIYEKNLVTGQSDVVDVSVSGVEKLKLVTKQNGSDSNDHTDWADAQVLGAIRDISKEGSGYKADMTGNTMEMQAKETFQVRIGLSNQESEENGFTAAISLYDADGSLLDMEMTKDYLDKGEKAGVFLKMELPNHIQGYRMHVNVWKTDTLELIAKTTYVSNQADRSDAEEEEETFEWIKTDGEQMEKVGNWKMWPSADAYEGTETYTGDTDTPLVEGASISYTFTGSKVRVGAKVDQSQVGAEVYIDGEKAGEIDNHSEEVVNEYRQVFESRELSEGEHTIKLVPTGKFGIDYIEYGVKKETEGSKPDDDKKNLKKELQAFVDFVETDTASIYTEESRKETADAAWQAYYILINETASKEEINGAALILKEKMEALQQKEEQKELSTEVLEYAYELSKTADTKGVVPKVLEHFDKAKENAKAILDKVKAGDPSITQEMIDESWQELIKAMQYLYFKQGDKEDLGKVIAMAEGLDLEQYVNSGKDRFEQALLDAQNVYKDENAMQEEVDTAWRMLLEAMSNLRLKPDKSLLERLVKECEPYRQFLGETLAKAVSVLEDEEATKGEVVQASEELAAALEKVKASGGIKSTNAQSGQNIKQSESTTAKAMTSTEQKSAKTGDDGGKVMAFLTVSALALLAAAPVCRRKNRIRRS